METLFQILEEVGAVEEVYQVFLNCPQAHESVNGVYLALCKYYVHIMLTLK